MNIQKAITIALKDMRILFSDRNLLLIMFVAPIALTAIIGAAFGNFTLGGGGDIPIQHIQIAVVNEDKGAQVFLQNLNYGNILTGIIIPPSGQTPDPNNMIYKLFDAKLMARDEAVRQVKTGQLTAAILIPSDFSDSLNPTREKPGQSQITIYRDSGSALAGSIVSSVVRGIVNSLTSGSLAIFDAQEQIRVGKAPQTLLLSSQAIAEAVNAGLQNAPISLSQTTISGQKQTNAAGFDPLQYFAPSMAIFFLTFTMASGAGSIIEEQNNWTLQRMISSPTQQSTILAGKLGGNYLNGLLQLSILIVVMALLGPILGAKSSVWGTNIIGIALVTVCAVAAASGLGTIIAGAARTAQQADTISNAVLILMAVAGGAFFDISQLGGPFVVISRFTLNFWATGAYKTLAQTGDLVSILPNLAVLLAMFGAYFGIGVFLFNRRLKV